MNNNLNEQPISQTESQEEKVFAGFTLNGFAALVMILAAYGVVAYTLNTAIDTDNTVSGIGSTVPERLHSARAQRRACHDVLRKI